MIGLLYQLAACHVAAARQMTGGVLFGITHVKQVGGACFLLPARQRRQRNARHASAIGNGAGLARGLTLRGFAGVAIAAALPMLQRMTGQRPANGAVAQREYRITNTGIDQRLRANNAARASGAIHNHRGAR